MNYSPHSALQKIAINQNLWFKQLRINGKQNYERKKLSFYGGLKAISTTTFNLRYAISYKKYHR